MSRKKEKVGTLTKRKSKKIDNDTENEDEIVEHEESVKRDKRSIKKGKKKTDDSDNEEQEDELSEIEVNDENENTTGGENDEILIGNKSNKPQRTNIDPKTPIGNLKTNEILNYLIQVGDHTLNPQLKFGTLELLAKLTGRRYKRYSYNGGGSKRGARSNYTGGGRNTNTDNFQTRRNTRGVSRTENPPETFLPRRNSRGASGSDGNSDLYGY